jgi:gamma-glutamyltranspeptidase / glutathione hydrolase
MSFTTRPVLRGSFGMVAATHWLATGAGMRMLELGGNAFDAAAAAGFVLQVVEPHQNGPGGDLPVVFWDGDGVRVLCAQGPAPAAATIERFAGLDLVPGDGLLPAVVPGAFDGWMLLVRDHGRLRLRDVLEPAIGYARDGFPVVAELAADVFEHASRWPSTAAIWLRDGGPRETFRLPEVAATYQRIVDGAEGGAREAEFDAARDAWYRGFVAEAIDAFCAREGGLLRGEDLTGWSASYEAPVTYDYGGLTVCKPGPWSQGPVFLQQLALLAGFPLDEMSAAERVHTAIECAKLAFADREAWYGDPDFVDVPLTELLSGPYNDERRRLVGADASFDLRPGSPGGRPAVLASGGDQAGASSAPVGSDTCGVMTADRFGNVVAAIPSGGWLKSSPAIPELGFCLGTRGQMFWLDERVPSGLAPGKRPRTTLSPTLALRDGAPYLAFGTPGGDGQDQWSLQFLLAHLGGLDLQAAMDAPKWTSDHVPSSFHPRPARPGCVDAEARLGDDVISSLRERGHDVSVVRDWSIGRLVAAGRDASGSLVAAADPRGMMRYAAGR